MLLVGASACRAACLGVLRKKPRRRGLLSLLLLGEAALCSWRGAGAAMGGRGSWPEEAVGERAGEALRPNKPRRSGVAPSVREGLALMLLAAVVEL